MIARTEGFYSWEKVNSRTKKTIKEGHGNMTGKPREIPDVHSVVNVEVGRTVALVQYESVRYTVGVRVPCAVGEEESAAENGMTFCEARLQDMVNRKIGV